MPSLRVKTNAPPDRRPVVGFLLHGAASAPKEELSGCIIQSAAAISPEPITQLLQPITPLLQIVDQTWGVPSSSHHPLPQIKLDCLADPDQRTCFLDRVYLYDRWRRLCESGLSHEKLLNFYAPYKYLMMAYSPAVYGRVGPLLANPIRGQSMQDVATQVIAEMMKAMAEPMARGAQANTLQHLQGYLKRELGAEEKAELSAAIDRFRRSHVPLEEPVNKLKHYFSRHPKAYIQRQYFLDPYPEAREAGFS